MVLCGCEGEEVGGVQHAAREVSGVCGDPGCYGLCYIVAMEYVIYMYGYLWLGGGILGKFEGPPQVKQNPSPKYLIPNGYIPAMCLYASYMLRYHHCHGDHHCHRDCSSGVQFIKEQRTYCQGSHYVWSGSHSRQSPSGKQAMPRPLTTNNFPATSPAVAVIGQV